MDDAAATYVPAPGSVTIPAPVATAVIVSTTTTTTVVSAVAVASVTRLVALLGWLGPLGRLGRLGSDGDRDDRAWGQRAAGLYGQHGARRLRRRWHPRQARPQAQPGLDLTTIAVDRRSG